MQSQVKNTITNLLTVTLSLIVATALPMAAPPAKAEVITNTLHITLLGDSYSAGTGAGS